MSDVTTRLAAEAQLRTGLMGALDRNAQRALDAPERVLVACGYVLASGIALVWIGWALARR